MALVKATMPARFHRDLAGTVGAGQLRHQARHFAAHDDRDHLEGRGIADPGEEEQRHEAREEPGEAARLQRQDHGQNAMAIMPTKTQKVTRPPPNLSDTQPVPARRQRADQRPEEDVLQRVHIGEGDLRLSSGKPAE